MTRTRTIALFAFSALAAACDPEPEMTGSLDVDMSGEEPVFLLQGTDAGDAPTRLEVYRCGAEYGAAWIVRDDAGLSGDIPYGELPGGSDETVAPLELEPGVRYEANIWAPDPVNGAPHSSAAWGLTFVHGEADSVKPRAQCP